MTEQELPFDGQLLLSRHLDYFRREEDYYVYHNLFGFILKMSEDVLTFLEFFRSEPKDAHQARERFIATLGDDLIAEFANVFALQRCLIDPEEAEEKKLRKFYPVHAKWTVYHEPKEGPVTLYLLEREPGDTVRSITLDAWDSSLWRKITGEVTCEAIIEAMRSVEGSPVTGLEDRVFATLARFSHADFQYIKMSSKPMSEFAGNKRYSMPPYLQSTMPYAKITEQVRGEEAGPRVHLGKSRIIEIDAATLERDAREASLAYIFRDPHPSMDEGRSYAGALLHHIEGRGGLPEGEITIAEVAGRNFALGSSLLRALGDRSVRYTLIVPTEALAEEGRAYYADAGLGDAVTLVVQEKPDLAEAEGAPFDLILCNEIAAELETIPVRKLARSEADDEEEEEEEEITPPKPTNGRQAGRDIFLAEGPVVNMIFRHALPLDDAPQDFFLNVGAIRLVEQSAKALKPNGVGLIMEYGDLYQYPKRTVVDEIETYSLHFGHLIHVARRLGYETDFGFATGKLNFDGTAEVLISTRAHFSALRALLADRDVTLEKRPYTPEEWAAFLTEHGVDPNAVHDITYDTLDNRVLGLLTHSFRLLSWTAA